MQELEAGRVAVLEVLELLEEHHRARRPVAVEERDPALRFGGQDRRHDRQHRRDAGAGGDHRVVLGVRRVELGGEPTGRGHHLEHVAGLHRLQRVRRERTVGNLLDPDPQRSADWRADRVVASHLVVGRAPLQREVLPLAERVVVRELVGHRERDRDTVVGEALDAGDDEVVEDGVGGCLGHVQNALKWSKGSRQLLQDHSALHAVDPNRLSSRVSSEPHWGHLTRQRQHGGASPCRSRPCPGARPHRTPARPCPRRSSSRWSTPGSARS